MSQQLPLPFGLDPEYTFARFLQGPNGEVVRHLECVAQGSGSSPVLIHGPFGSGKTHLLQACCMAAATRGQSAMTLPMKMIREQGPLAIDGLGEIDCLCLDDIESVIGDTAWEDALFLLFNALKDREAHLVMTARTPPDSWPFVLKDLHSRLASGPIIALKPLSESESIQALIGHASALGLEMSEAVAHYLVRRVQRDLGSLLRQLDQLDRASMAAARRLTIPFVRSIIDNDP